MDQITLHRADLVIEALRVQYDTSFAFDMACSQYLQGKVNETLRKAVMLRIGGEELPASKCTMPLVVEKLRAHYMQSTLFTLTMALG